ncbi:hypothetical protein PPYR_15037 [Photinus pyralis]|uniref:Acyl-coenzyme A oxidase n=2 Tax=Photinus pyralis TaxID=7054 RepID=A0A1Y1LYL3_PHOPY|nr:peroxisomal acyl-coenzyme A oxidase 3-like isoform X2 [Photinus pyralis]KAB0790565.1 hypothetical protein PPYR_15037 [Photinus pyralis]
MAKTSSFNYEIMRAFLFGEDALKQQELLLGELKNQPVFFLSPGETLAKDELHRRSVQKAFKYADFRKTFATQNFNPFREAWVGFMGYADKDAGVQEGIFNAMFGSAIGSMGTERHVKFLEELAAGKMVGAFCLTEIAHGSNTKMVQTQAVYDKVNREYVLKTPNFEAAKCWSGNLGKFATHVILYAQLIIPGEGVYGLHGFVVPIRDGRTLLPYPGITIAEMGEKTGLQGIDNGIMMFNNYRIPKENLLNRVGDVNDEGKYVRQIANLRKQNTTSLGVLSNGRIGITLTCVVNLSQSLVFALRYLENEPKIPTSVNYDLMPYLAVVYVSNIFARTLFHYQLKFMTMAQKGEGDLAAMGMEMHAVSSASKPVFSWVARDGIQKAIEACRSLGFHRATELDKLRGRHDANCTYEGDNNVLIQQTANWLLKLWSLMLKGQVPKCSLAAISFLDRNILESKFNSTTIQEFTNVNNLQQVYRWLVAYLLKKTHDRQQRLLKGDNLGSFWAKNENQIYHCKSLAFAFIENCAIQTMDTKVQEVHDERTRNVLNKLLSLYAVWNLHKYVHLFYEGRYANGPTFGQYVEDSTLMLCKELQSDQSALVNVIALPDVLELSILGHPEGQIYDRMESALLQYACVFSEPNWGMEISSYRSSLKSKL